MKKLSIILPCYNEGKNIYKNVQIVAELFRKEEKIIPFEIIAVNDGSPDNTLSELRRTEKVVPELRVVTYDKNQGKGNAIRAGVAVSEGEYVAFVDADREIPAEQLIGYYHFAKYGGFDVVIGSKTHPLSNTKFSLLRKILSMGYRTLNRTLFNLYVQDTQVGIKLFSREVADTVFPSLKTRGYAFDIEFLSLAHKLNYSIFEAPVQIFHSQDRSSIGIKTIIEMFIDTFKIRFEMPKTLAELQMSEQSLEANADA